MAVVLVRSVIALVFLLVQTRHWLNGRGWNLGSLLRGLYAALKRRSFTVVRAAVGRSTRAELCRGSAQRSGLIAALKLRHPKAWFFQPGSLRSRRRTERSRDAKVCRLSKVALS